MHEKMTPNQAEYRPPAVTTTRVAAYLTAFVVDRFMGEGLTTDGHKLLRQLVVRVCKGEKVSISRDASRVYAGANLSIYVDGQQNIPASGPTLFIGNHTWGGPLKSMGQFFEVAKQGNAARHNVKDEETREPFLVMQRGIGKQGLQAISGMFYEMAAHSLGCEIVEIPRYEGDQIINRQGIPKRAIGRLTDGGAMLWYPQGRHRDSDDLRFPIKSNKFLNTISEGNTFTQLVPVRAFPDEKGNMILIFGQAVDLAAVVQKGGIEYFSEHHLATLGKR